MKISPFVLLRKCNAIGSNRLQMGLTAITFAGLAGALTGCSTAPSLTDDKAFWETRVEERARARWQLIIDKKYAEAYEYFSEASRQGYTLELFTRQMKNIDTRAVSVKPARCGPEQCSVGVETTIEYSIPRIGRRMMPLPVDEVWVVNNKQAYLVRR